MLQQFYPVSPHPYRYELNKDMTLSTAHYLPDNRTGACANVHGHTYFINITVAGDELDDLGMLVNFRDLKTLVHGRWDHSLLNDDKELFSNEDGSKFPTTEVVAATVWKLVQKHLQSQPNKPVCLQVIVRETPSSYVVYRPKSGVDAL